MPQPADPLILTERFTAAVDYARQLHTEFRKGTQVPFMAHLLGVASLVMGEAGGRVPVTEDMAIAAILHDVVEDKGGMPRLHEIEERFGANVARMVAGLSDTFAGDHDQKEGWEERKNGYLERLRKEADDVLLISAADKLYNAKSILDDYRVIKDAVWERFKRGADKQLWYFNELIVVFRAHPANKIVDDLERVVRELEKLVRADLAG
jgi:Guanosine polyphosphate pyrophosphohydrolases/synthetases